MATRLSYPCPCSDTIIRKLDFDPRKYARGLVLIKERGFTISVALAGDAEGKTGEENDRAARATHCGGHRRRFRHRPGNRGGLCEGGSTSCGARCRRRYGSRDRQGHHGGRGQGIELAA